MNGYNLTDRQKELLRKLVKHVKEGKLKEPIALVGTDQGYFISLRRGGTLKHQGDLIGDLDALCDAGLMGFRWEKGNKRYNIKQAGYGAVDSDFEVPLIPESPALAQPMDELEIVTKPTVEEKSIGEPSPKRVFVVHGRNENVRRSMFDLLRAVGLEPIEWTLALKLTGKPSPYIGEVLDSLFTAAGAVVVVLTGDDEAKLRDKYIKEDDSEYEKVLAPQARPNVLFEAGMAFGRYPSRTLLVVLGTLRPFSDIAGRHLIKLDNSTQKRQELAMKLETAGCPVDLSGTDWHTAGDFEIDSEREQTAHTVKAWWSSQSLAVKAALIGILAVLLFALYILLSSNASLILGNVWSAIVSLSPAASTPTATSTSTLTPIPFSTPTSIPYPAPVLVSPDRETAFEKGQDVKLQWEWEQDLARNEFFEVRIRLKGEPEFGSTGLTRIPYLVISASELTRTGTYEWKVTIVLLSGEEKGESQIWSFDVE